MLLGGAWGLCAPEPISKRGVFFLAPEQCFLAVSYPLGTVCSIPPERVSVSTIGRIMSKTTSTFQVENRLRHIAAQQNGLFSTSQAMALGVAKESLRKRVSNGMLERCFSGVYRLTSTAKTFEQICVAACIATGGALTGTTAGVLHGFPIGRRPTTPEIVLPHGVQYRSTGISVRQTRFYPSTQAWNSGLITTPAATVVALAQAVDLKTLARCLDYGIAEKLLTVKAVAAELNGRIRFRGRADLLSELAARSDGRLKHRSKLEGRVAGWIRQCGLAEPETNVILPTRLGGIEADFVWRSQKVILEVSPFATHGSQEKQERDAFRRRALILAGWRIVEATDSDLASSSAFAKIASELQLLLS